MSRRAATLLVAAAGVLIAIIVAVVAPVPYVALMPGPTLNTLGSVSGKPLIQVKNHPTYQTTGNLNMVTVSLAGGPGTKFNIFAALRAWLSPNDAVVPESEIFTPGQSPGQVAKEDTEEMASSQQTATAAALCQLKINFRTVDRVEATVPGMPAAGMLHPGDVIAAVDGTPVTCRSDAGALIKARKPGAPVELTILRRAATEHVRLVTANSQGVPEIGVQIIESYVFPFNVSFSVGNIGGPSAGMMFALGIIDKITPDNLTGGRFIAGTGEIEANGTVDPIGGIQQKMAGARAAGATVFMTPAANCPDTSGSVPAGLRLIKVSSLAGAIADLNALKAGRTVPSC
jgi:PDZ domain-containing protein